MVLCVVRGKGDDSPELIDISISVLPPVEKPFFFLVHPSWDVCQLFGSIGRLQPINSLKPLFHASTSRTLFWCSRQFDRREYGGCKPFLIVCPHKNMAFIWSNPCSGKWCFVRDVRLLEVRGYIDSEKFKVSVKAMQMFVFITLRCYRLSDNFYSLLVRKFDRDGTNTIKFDDFIQCCVLLQSLTAAFKYHDTDFDGWIRISYEEFLTLVFSLRM
ncbi:programmed cell death protein 6 [Nephila pilipes]|uniref:Programmed cell death protein 6 n=1 Tax=Nephila pilipes TaxID=299642 RepID=A0A8X6PZY0_NEPPI|nr:programmed cell death protein 6 [Nephila pilipes]GFU15343.1 programmed cell death protein 6 [Nephila pilipes]